MQVVMLAGGEGTRMGELARQLPKPMIPLAGKPVLERQIELARRFDCTDIILLTGYLGQVIQEHFRDGADWGVRIRYVREDRPLGTAGAIKDIEDRLEDDFLVFYGDIVMDVDLEALMAFHAEKKLLGTLGTLVVHPNNHPDDSDLLEIDHDGRVTAFYPKPRDDPNRCYRNLAGAALYVLSSRVLGHVPKGRPCDLGRDVFPKVIESGEPLFGYNTPEYICDVGTVDRLKEVEADVRCGKVARLNRRNRRRAILLDRDGVLNVDEGRDVTSAEELELLPGVCDAIRAINESEYLAVVVSNQPAIAKGFMSERELARVHARLETLLGAEHAYLDRIYYCPHHPEKGFDGERPEYKVACECRKPAPGMLLAAAAELNIDLAGSFMIGDRPADIKAGSSAGVKTILVRTGHAGRDAGHPTRPDFVFEDLSEAVRFVLNNYGQPSQVAERDFSKGLPK